MEQNRNLIFKQGITYQEQIENVIKLIHSDKKADGTGQTAIGKLFGITRGSIHSHMKRMKKVRKHLVGRPPLLNEIQDSFLIEYVSNSYIQKQSPNLYTLIDVFFNKFDIFLNYHSVHNSKKMKTVLAPVYESKRAEVELDDIAIYYEQLDMVFFCNKVPPAFVFNVDESGFVGFVDMRDEIVIVPIDAPDGTVKGADRNSKRATMVGCISLDGTVLMPCVVIPSKRYEKELIINGYGEQNVLVLSQENGFISSKSFSYWAETVFMPELNRRRQKYNYFGEAVLLLDGCAPHTSDYISKSFSFFRTSWLI